MATVTAKIVTVARMTLDTSDPRERSSLLGHNPSSLYMMPAFGASRKSPRRCGPLHCGRSARSPRARDKIASGSFRHLQHGIRREHRHEAHGDDLEMAAAPAAGTRRRVAAMLADDYRRGAESRGRAPLEPADRSMDGVDGGHPDANERRQVAEGDHGLSGGHTRR